MHSNSFSYERNHVKSAIDKLKSSKIVELYHLRYKT